METLTSLPHSADAPPTLPAQTKAKPHHWVSRALHWLCVLLVVYAAARNGGETQALVQPAAMRRETWFGVVLAIVFAARWLWMYLGPGGGSPLSNAAPRWEKLLSRAVHQGMYALVFAMVMSGWLMALWVETDVRMAMANVEGVLKLAPQGTPRFEFLRQLHHQLAHALGVLILVHVVGALRHALVKKEGVFQSMVRWRK
jgi:cytochrome b561